MMSDLPAIRHVPAFDAHGHHGRYLDADPLLAECCSATAAEVAARACGVVWTVVSPLDGPLPRGRGQRVAEAHERACAAVAATPRLLQYVIVNPLQPETFDQARRMLRSEKCVGIKIHPEEHAYRIADHGDELFRFFEETTAPAMTHGGCPNSLPEDFVPFADRHPGARVMLAHLGHALEFFRLPGPRTDGTPGGIGPAAAALD